MSTKAQAHARQSKALTLRRESKSYREIAEALDFCDPGAAYQAVLAAEKRELIREADGTARSIALSQIESIIAVFLPKILAGDDMMIPAFVKLDQRRARLLGLDAPEKHELMGTEIVLDVIGTDVRPTSEATPDPPASEGAGSDDG